MTDMREKLFEVLDIARSECPEDWDVKFWQADAIIAALPDMVKPLEWSLTAQTTYKSQSYAGVYECYPNMQGNWTLDDGESVSAHADVEAAKKAANKEEARRILSALGVTEGK